MLGADSSLADIINFICINAMPVHLILSSGGLMQVSKGVVK